MKWLQAGTASVAAAVVLGVLGFALPARAQNVVRTFVTVDSVQLRSNGVNVTGLLEGEATPTTVFVATNGSSDTGPSAGLAAACQRTALLVMLKPGQFQLRLDPMFSSYSWCTLVKVAP